ncbi:MAG: class I SAM-dependent methyltransferase [Sciscionella sp.]
MRRAIALLALLLAALPLTSVRPLSAAQQPDAKRKLFPPADLDQLDTPDRDQWQQPERIMDALGIFDGAKVADLGAGGGWFTSRLAHRVGPNGRVFAEDVQHEMIDAIARMVDREGLTNVTTILGSSADPNLPTGLQAILIVDTYPQFPDPVALLKHVAAALAPNGHLGIVDFKRDGGGGPGPALEDRLDADVIVRHAADAGLALKSREKFLRYQYLLVFGRK